MVVSHELVGYSVSGTRAYVDYEFTDHLGGKVKVSKLVPVGTDTDADMLSMYPKIEAQLAAAEVEQAVNGLALNVSPEKTADHQTQADYDRRVLGRVMLMTDAHAFHAAYPLYLGMQARGGANAPQRASYLGVPTGEYADMEARFNNVHGVEWFLTDEKNQTWGVLPGGWE